MQHRHRTSSIPSHAIAIHSGASSDTSKSYSRRRVKRVSGCTCIWSVSAFAARSLSASTTSLRLATRSWCSEASRCRSAFFFVRGKWRQERCSGITVVFLTKSFVRIHCFNLGNNVHTSTTVSVFSTTMGHSVLTSAGAADRSAHRLGVPKWPLTSSP